MKSDTWLKNLVIAGLFIIPFTAIPVTESFFFPFITGKNFMFRILVEIIFAGWALLALHSPRYRPHRSPLFLAYLSFMLVVLFADIFGVHPYRSIWSNFERMEGLVGHLHYFAYFTVLISMFKTEDMWRRWFNVSIGVSVYESLFGLIQLAGLRDINQGGVRVDGTFGNAIYFAVYLLFHIYFCIILATRKGTSKALQWTYGSIAVLHLIVLYTTATRGAILGLLGSAFLVAVAFLFVGTGKTRKVSAGLICGLLLFVIGFYSIRNTSFVQNSAVLRRFSHITTETTVLSRRYIYPMSFEGFKEHPILGWGQENYNIVFNKYYDPHLYAQEQWFDRSHNVFLDWLIAGGILGLLTYLSLFGTALYLLFRARHIPLHERILFVGLLSAYFAQNLTVFDNLISYLFFFTVLAHIHFHGTLDSRERVTADEGHFVGSMMIPQVFVGIALLVTLYYVNVRPVMASVELIHAIQPSERGIAGALEDFKRVIALNTFATSEAREQLVQLAMQVARSNEVSASDKQAFLEFSREQVLAQVAFYPDDARYRLFAGGFFSRVGLNDEGVAELKKALELSPKKQTLHFELANAYINQKEYGKALELLRTAYELEPEFKEARKLYGLGLIYAGKYEEAEALMKPVFGTFLIDDDNFLKAFIERKRFDYMVTISERRVLANPNDARNYVDLAASLWGDKKYTASRTALQKAQKLDATIKIDDYIKLFTEKIK